MNLTISSYDQMMLQLRSAKPHVTEFMELEKVIRLGAQADSPKILFRYLELGDLYAVEQTKSLQIEIYARILALLLDTICDACIPKHWRQLCLDYSYKPLSAMEKLSSSDVERHSFRQQYQTFRTLTHYFC